MFKKYILEIIVFTSGAVVMAFELAGSRVLGPYLGTSIFVWTSIIGIILGSLSLGYWLGGRIADKSPTIGNLSLILLVSAACVALTILIKDMTVEWFFGLLKDVKLTAVFASMILFTPASILLGMVSPYAVRLKMENVKTSGTTVGNLYAISTIGSIAGTFAAGFYLIPQLGTTNILVVIAGMLVLLSMVAYVRKFFKTKVAAIGLILVILVIVNFQQQVKAAEGIIDVDTQYSRVKIWDEGQGIVALRRMQINNEHSSAMYINSDALAYAYTKFYDLAAHFKPDFERTLIIGGAGYSYPKHFLAKYPEATMDVVEIDPKITDLALEYFNLEENPRLRIFHEDGRTFLNYADGQYDVIYGDAFKSFVVPYQLTTKEAVQKQYDLLSDDGVVLLNMIASMKDEKGSMLLRAEYATYLSVFPQVYLFPVQPVDIDEAAINVMMVALKSEEVPAFTSEDEEINGMLSHLWTEEIPRDLPILTDDHAPVEMYAVEVK